MESLRAVNRYLRMTWASDGFAWTNNWFGFKACHIFPLQHESLWDQVGYGRWVTGIEDNPVRAGVNSGHNGLMLLETAHTKFDRHTISANPDDNYKIIVFDIDIFGLDGRILDPACRSVDNPHHVPDELLRWHFHQTVLANVRGA
ncbi:hypothetical protein HOY80DRAFT_1088317 [Tuber brumale]|nr:hypothetical protein HOY80DRAFT_1088317 [Tuber brumale]